MKNFAQKLLLSLRRLLWWGKRETGIRVTERQDCQGDQVRRIFAVRKIFFALDIFKDYTISHIEK
jgi:hypothetical protein